MQTVNKPAESLSETCKLLVLFVLSKHHIPAAAVNWPAPLSYLIMAWREIRTLNEKKSIGSKNVLCYRYCALCSWCWMMLVSWSECIKVTRRPSDRCSGRVCHGPWSSEPAAAHMYWLSLESMMKCPSVPSRLGPLLGPLLGSVCCRMPVTADLFICHCLHTGALWPVWSLQCCSAAV